MSERMTPGAVEPTRMKAERLAEIRALLHGSQVPHTAAMRCAHELLEALTSERAICDHVGYSFGATFRYVALATGFEVSMEPGSSPDELVAHVRAVMAERDALRAEAERMRKLFADAGQGEHNVLALIDHYQRAVFESDDRVEAMRRDALRLEGERESVERIACDVLRCALAWEAGARLIGNVSAREIARLAASAITSCPACGAEPWVNIDCIVCTAMSEVTSAA